MSKNLDQLVDELSALSVPDMSYLKEMLEDKWGVKAAAAAPAMMAMAAPAAAGDAPAAASTDFEVTLISAASDKRIGIIKIVRELTGLGLKEAKDLVEGVPKALKTGVSEDEAKKLKAEIEQAGGTCEIK